MQLITETNIFLSELVDSSESLIDRDKYQEYLYENRAQSFFRPDMIRVMVEGRFKSGKSTLINALAQRKLAAVDYSEKTAWIARYWPCEEDFCQITYKDESIEAITIDKFMEMTGAKEIDTDYFDSVSRIDVGYKSNLGFALIDTPGTGTITRENELRVNEALNDADIVLYVVDLDSIGNQSDNIRMQAIRDSGIPMLCIGNKYDDDIAAEYEIDEVREMVAKYTDFAAEDIFIVSAQNHCDYGADSAEMDQLIERLNATGINKPALRKKAQKSRDYRMIRLLLAMLRGVKRKVSDMEKSRLAFEYLIRKNEMDIESKLEIFMRNYVHHNLFSEYKTPIINAMRSRAESGGNIDGNAILRSIVPDDYLDIFWEGFTGALCTELSRLWEMKLLDYKDTIEDTQEHSLGKFRGNRFFMDYNDITESFKLYQDIGSKGISLSLKLGGAMTWFEAVLGANAASVTLGGALITTGIPIVAMGAALTAGYIYMSRRREQINVDYAAIVDKEIDDFAESIIIYCKPLLQQLEEAVRERILSNYDKRLQGAFPYNMDINTFSDKLDDRIEKFENELANIEVSLDVTSDIDLLKGKLKDLSRKQQENEKDLELAIQDKETAENKLNEKDNELSDNKKRLELVTGKKKKLEQDLIQAGKDVDELKDQIGECNKRINDLKKKIKESNALNTEEIKRLKVQIDNLCQEKKELLNNLDRIRKKIERLSQDIRKQNATIISLISEIKELEGEISNLEEKIRKKDDRIKTLNKELGETKAKLQEAINNHTNNDSGSNDYFSILEKIRKDVEDINADSTKKYRIDDEGDKVFSCLDPLALLEDGEYDKVIGDIRSLCKEGENFIKEFDKNHIPLQNNYHILIKQNLYKLYFKMIPVSKKIRITYIDVFAAKRKRYEKFKYCIRRSYLLNDDQMRYKIFDMINSAQREILIESPWITENGWTHKINGMSFKAEITKALNDPRRKVKVIIVTGYNIDGEYHSGSSEKEQETIEMVAEIKEEFKAFGSRIRVLDHTGIHDKSITVDNTCAMVGSYNMLSNIGEYTNGYFRTGESMDIKENALNVENQRMKTYDRISEEYIEVTA